MTQEDIIKELEAMVENNNRTYSLNEHNANTAKSTGRLGMYKLLSGYNMCLKDMEDNISQLLTKIKQQ